MKNTTLQDIRELSTGTLSTLSGYRSYENIDCMREKLSDFTEKIIEAGETFTHWQEAWKSFVKESVGSGNYKMAEIIPNAKDLVYQSQTQREHLGLLLDSTVREHINSLSPTEIKNQLSELREELKRSKDVLDNPEPFGNREEYEKRHSLYELEKKYLISSYLLAPDEEDKADQKNEQNIEEGKEPKNKKPKSRAMKR